MAYAGARLMAAAFRSIGVPADTTPDSDDQTLELGNLYSTGEECLPHKITLGDFLKICRMPEADPKKLAFFMPRAPGPCRFGQYAPYLTQVLRQQGFGDAVVFSPNSNDGYDGIGEHASEMIRTAWLAIVVGDLSMRFLLKTRPYETSAGDSDAAFSQAVDDFGQVLAEPGLSSNERVARLTRVVARVRDRFRAIPARYVKDRPLIGVVGEIYCRLNAFSNENAIRRVERLGGECWLSDVSEWVWYTNWSREYEWARDHGRLNLEFLRIKLKSYVQRQYEHTLLAAVEPDLRGYEEPHDIREVLSAAEPYLPATGALGEMTLSVGKALYLYGKGADGIIDISPFTCMNGITSEAVYPAISAEHDDLPIRSLYFDKVSSHIDRDLEIFLDLARAYQRRKRWPRTYPEYFERAPDSQVGYAGAMPMRSRVGMAPGRMPAG
jgi:predicted nucleotide-binding protein (sugar kinase/HSP70/actin superfamily)